MSHPVVTPQAMAAIYQHARREYPRECCGVVFGARSDRRAARVHACVNVQDRLHAEDPQRHPRDARTAFALDARDLFTLSRSLRSDEPAKVVYHSHVDTGAYFSDTDQAAAVMDGEPSYPVEHLVVEIRADGVHGAAQFAWHAGEGRYVEIARYDAGGTPRAPAGV